MRRANLVFSKIMLPSNMLVNSGSPKRRASTTLTTNATTSGGGRCYINNFSTVAQHVHIDVRNDSDDNNSGNSDTANTLEEVKKMEDNDTLEEQISSMKIHQQQSQEFGKACNCHRSPHEVFHPVDTKPMPIDLSDAKLKPCHQKQHEPQPQQQQVLNKPPSHNSNFLPNSERLHTCRNYYVENDIPFPPPLPQPKYSFYRRVLPPSLTQLSSPQGKILFKESLMSGCAESFFPLSEQFSNQSDPAYCGVTSLVMILNAIGIDPNIRWKGGWRWYGSEDMILGDCCIESERVRRAGISMEEYQSLGRCQGLQVQLKRPMQMVDDDDNDDNNNNDNDDGSSDHTANVGEAKGEDEEYTIEEFRNDIKFMTQNPPLYEIDTDELDANNGDAISTNNLGGFMVVSFSRIILGQTGDGHFSPIAAYHEPTDQCLILDVARFKYSPYWVSIADLYEAMKPADPTTKKSRGWFLNHPPDVTSHWNHDGEMNENSSSNKDVKYKYSGSKAKDEVKRPASEVPLFQNGKSSGACPVGKIKVEYCSVAK